MKREILAVVIGVVFCLVGHTMGFAKSPQSPFNLDMVGTWTGTMDYNGQCYTVKTTHVSGQATNIQNDTPTDDTYSENVTMRVTKQTGGTIWLNYDGSATSDTTAFIFPMSDKPLVIGLLNSFVTGFLSEYKKGTFTTFHLYRNLPIQGFTPPPVNSSFCQPCDSFSTTTTLPRCVAPIILINCTMNCIMPGEGDLTRQ